MIVENFVVLCCGVCLWFKSGNDWIISSASSSNKFFQGDTFEPPLYSYLNPFSSKASNFAFTTNPQTFSRHVFAF
jgi:hypothetical protein